MKKFLKWTGFVVTGIAMLMVIASAWVYFSSARALDRRHDVAAPPALALPTEAREIAEGRHLAQLTGCLDCHGADLTGHVVDDIPDFLRLVAPNISAMLPNYTDEQLITVLRKGVKPDGTTVLFMPSEMFRHLRDEDLARLIAFLRTVPPAAGIEEKSELRILGRIIVATGEVELAADAIPSLPPPVRSVDPEDPLSLGRYLVMNSCTECHGQDLAGFTPINAPDLLVATAYSPEQFARLMRSGVGLGDRPLRFMSHVAKGRFTHLRDAELQAIYSFLQSRGPG